MSCEEVIALPKKAEGEDRFLRTNGANNMYVPFRAVAGFKEEPSYTFQEDSRTGWYLKDGKIWVVEGGRVTYMLSETSSVWGGITGDINDQTDLIALIDSMSGGGGASSFADLSGDPDDNTLLAAIHTGFDTRLDAAEATLDGNLEAIAGLTLVNGDLIFRGVSGLQALPLGTGLSVSGGTLHTTGGGGGGAGAASELENDSTVPGDFVDEALDYLLDNKAAVGTDGQVILPEIASPSAAAADTVEIFAAQTLRPQLAYIGEHGHIQKVQNSLADVHVGLWETEGQTTSGTPTLWGWRSLTTSGTSISQENFDVTNIYTRTRRIRYFSSNTAGAVLTWRTTVRDITLSDGTMGGFYLSYVLAHDDVGSVLFPRMFWGIKDSNTQPTNVDPATLTNCIGLAQLDSDQTQYYICYGGSSAQTPIALGTDFPPTAKKLHRLQLYAPATEANKVYYQVDNLSDGFTAVGSITGGSSVIPQSSTALNPLWAFRTNNISGAQAALVLSKMYIETEI